jgi:hypothetical protein
MHSTARPRVAGLLGAVLSMVLLFQVGFIGLTAPASAADIWVNPLNSYSALVSWTPPTGAARVEIYRDGRLIDAFPSWAGKSYTDYLLWKRTAYTYGVKIYGADGTVLKDSSFRVTTPDQVGSFPRLYSDTSFWNTTIASRPSVASNSAAMVKTSLTNYASLGVVNNDDKWGIPFAYATPRSNLYSVACLLYGCDLAASFRIPRYAKVNTGSDGHLAVYDPAANTELDLWQGAYNPTLDAWSASARSVTSADWGAACPLGQRCAGGGTAAGFLEFAGVIRPEEIAQGHIDHALVISMPYVRANYIACPGTHYIDSSNAYQSTGYYDDPNALPLGARVQLDPKFDVNAQAWPSWKKVVARALQKYGAYVADISGSLELRGEANLTRGYDAWAKVGMGTSPKPSIRDLPWGRFRVLTIQPC